MGRENEALVHFLFLPAYLSIPGQWSGSTPHCQPVRCTALEILDAHLRVLSLNNR